MESDGRFRSTEMRGLVHWVRPWFQRLPPVLGAAVDVLILSVLLIPATVRGPLARQLPLLVVVLVVFSFLSYGWRVRVRRGPDSGEEQRENNAVVEPPE